MTDSAGRDKGQTSPFMLILLSLIWAMTMMASGAVNLFLLERIADTKSGLLIIFFGMGALMAFPLTVIALRTTPARWQAGQKFAFAFIALSLLTIGLTAFVFALHFRMYFAQWHDDALSVRLFFETVFTILSAVYQFLVLGLRLYLPLGLIALLGASWALATKRI